jgi:hypothetical protein
MESGLQDQQRAIQTNSNVLWIVQLTPHISGNDEQHLQGHVAQKMGNNLHGQHSHLFQRVTRTSDQNRKGFAVTTETQPLPQSRKMQIC